jgi:hypothetical protein
VHPAKPVAYVSSVRTSGCATTVQLHAVEELWEMMSVDSDTEYHIDQSDSEVQLHMILSREALLAGNSSRALKFLGDIHSQAVMILLDSESSHSFINEKIAQSLQDVSAMYKSVQVQVANG